MSENKRGNIGIEITHNLDDVEERLGRILAKLKEAVELKERLEANEVIQLRDKVNELEATIQVLVDNKEEERDHDGK